MIYKLNNILVSSFGAIPIISSEKISLSGIFDCPKRKSPTERSWDTEIEPFVDAEDIKFDGRELSISFVLLKTGNLDAFKQALISCKIFTIENIDFKVLCRSEIEVTEAGNYYKLAVKYWQDEIVLPALVASISTTGSILIDTYNLHDNFGIHSSADGGFHSVGPRLDVNTTETYQITDFRDYRELSINCFMVGTSFTDLFGKMTQFHALLYKPGMRTLTIDGNSYSCYCKSGFKAQYVADSLLKFTLKLSTND